MTLTVREKEKIDEMIYENEKMVFNVKNWTEKRVESKFIAIGMARISRELGYEPYTVHDGKDWLKRLKR